MRAFSGELNDTGCYHWNRMASRWVISGEKGNCEFEKFTRSSD